MNLKEFVEKINLYAEDIGCMRDGKIGAHNIEARIMVEDTAGNEYSIEDIEVGYLGGCSCPADITIFLSKEP